ncbi:MAG: polymer-forming cytoskeletal protein, partial [Spirochaetota bacterium]
SARILGDIRTPELIIQNGVLLEGRCTIANDQKASARDVIETEYEKNRIVPEEFIDASKKGPGRK